nr:sulfate reduction electron transfer complex DsrMKJOP subunit DsrJ [Desulfobulbaceae bacterium]
MYDSGKVITGLAIFVAIICFPLWYNVINGAERIPIPLMPKDQKKCVAPSDYMRKSHMVLLNDWRDEVVRTGEREFQVIDGKKYEKSLQNGCMNCHQSREKFCTSCHTYAAVTPYCWDCHVEPKEMN